MSGHPLAETPCRFDLHAALRDSGLHAVPRAAAGSAWDTAWRAMRYQSLAYSLPMLDYQHAYLRGAGWELQDISLVLQNDGRPCGLWPLAVGIKPEGSLLTSGGTPVLAPLFVEDLSPRTVKKICTRAIAFLRIVCAQLTLSAVNLEQDPAPGAPIEGTTEWHQQLMAARAAAALKHDLYVDLRSDLAVIRAGFRKSFRPLINSGLRDWTVFVMDQESPSAEAWAEFKQLHATAAGRITRNEETWAVQFSMLTAGQAFLVGLRDPATGHLVGAGFFQVTRDEGLYAVGAYDRSLFDKPLGHVVQQVAIERMKATGLRWYRIGERQYAQDQPPPSDKQVAISEFKQGFASHTFCRCTFVLSASDRPVGASTA